MKKLLVKEKPINFENYGAVQFKVSKAKKSLVNYPGVNHWGSEYRFSTETQWGGIPVNDNDWLVTDAEGETHVMTNEEFTKKMVYDGCGLCHQRPKMFGAKQFNKAIAESNGLIKYPGVKRYLRSRYLDSKPQILNPANHNELYAEAKKHRVVVSSLLGVACVPEGNSTYDIVRLPMNQQITEDERGFGIFKHTVPVVKNYYDDKDPRLKDLYWCYWLNGQRIHENDWILIGDDGLQHLCTPSEFRDKYDPCYMHNWE